MPAHPEAPAFQLPWLPERKLAAGGFRPLRKLFRISSRPGTFSPAELDRYAAAAAVLGCDAERMLVPPLAVGVLARVCGLR